MLPSLGSLSWLQAVAVKTGELVAKLRLFEQPITQAALAEPGLKLNVALQRFLYGVASAEPSLKTA